MNIPKRIRSSTARRNIRRITRGISKWWRQFAAAEELHPELFHHSHRKKTWRELGEEPDK